MTTQRSIVVHALVAMTASILGIVDVASAAAAPEPVRWIAQTDGFWDVGANWSTGVVPGPNDDVVIDVPHNTTVTHRQGSDVVRSLRSRNPVIVSGGVLTLDAASTIDNTLSLRGGTLLGPGELTVVGPFEWTGGILAEGHMVARGGISISGPDSKAMAFYTLDNAGIASWRDADIAAKQSVINNLSGATLRLGDRCFCGSGTFVNYGILDKISGTGTARFTGPVENAGQVLVRTGRLELAFGGAIGGSFWSNMAVRSP